MLSIWLCQKFSCLVKGLNDGNCHGRVKMIQGIEKRWLSTFLHFQGMFSEALSLTLYHTIQTFNDLEKQGL